jgi:hypothetical protein
MIAAGKSGSPTLRLALSTGLQILTVEPMETTPRKLEFGGRRRRGKTFGAVLGQEMANEGGWETMG